MDSIFSDFDSYSESCSSEDQDDINSLFGGLARSIFSSLEETIEKIDDFFMFERGFTHGDIVCMVSDPLGPTGKVVNVDLTVDLEKINGIKIQNVSSKNLQKIRAMSVDDYVALGACIGKVDKIVDRLTIMFDDGTKCQITARGPEKIIPISPDLVDDPQYPFYPGQRVQVESPSLSKSTGWLCGMRKDTNYEQGTVVSVEAGLVYVDWLGCADISRDKEPGLASWQDSKDLSLLSSFTHAHWQLGDWCVQSGDQGSNFQQIFIIVKTKSKVDVQWQDGSQSLGLDSNVLYPVNVTDVHDFWPGMFVLEKGTVDDSQVRWGMVRSVDSKERTVKVKWCDGFLNRLDCEEKRVEEIVSAYELAEHPEYSFCLGEAVFKTNDCFVDLAADQSENFENKFLSQIGIVVGFKDENVDVKWATGTTSKVAPYEIRRIGKCGSATVTFLPSNENVQQLEELPVQENKVSGQTVQDTLDLRCGNGKDSTSYSLPQIAIDAFTSITSSLFGSLSTSMSRTYPFALEDEKILDKSPEVLELCNFTPGGQEPIVDDSEMPAKETSEQIKEASVNIKLPAVNEHPESVKQFDMVSDCSDHHFFEGPGAGLQSTQLKRGWLKKVNQEWSILEKNLPKSIYVRVYEERMDLLRAAIVGTTGTPYHDNLFFFDIYLPQQYPNEPPMVYYNSGGLRINPNLYESGKVCLSLLNTWTGSQNEVWNPESSTILQVLLSLQALVLNEKPYFNEAGYDSQIGKAEGEKNSINYNENAFLVSCRSMLYLLRRPPKHFDGLVHENFSSRGRSILLACEAYMEGAPIGYPFGSENVKLENQKGSSTGFKIMLGKLVPRLVEAFSEKGIDCSNLPDQVP